MRGRAFGWFAAGSFALVSCATLFDDPVQCHQDADCVGFVDARCDGTHGVCVAAEDAGQAHDQSSASSSSSTSASPTDAAPYPPCGPTDSDPHQCGRCGHDCLGGTCLAGVCQPVVVASGQAQPAYVTVDATHVYWTNSGSGTVVTVPLAGGAPAVLATGAVPRVWAIVVSPAGVFWTENGGTRVAAAPLDGGPSYLIADGQDAPRGIATDGARIYWTNEGNDAGYVESALPDGTDITPLSPQQGGSKDIAVQGGWLYFANANDGSIVKMRTDGHGARPIVSNQPGAFGLTADATNVYFTTYVDGGAVAQVKSDGTGLLMLAKDQASPRAIASDNVFVYWTTERDGTVRKVPIGGGPTTILATGQLAPWGIAVDGAAVYWAARGGGFIMKLAK